jgi:hypothetical protein
VCLCVCGLFLSTFILFISFVFIRIIRFTHNFSLNQSKYEFSILQIRSPAFSFTIKIQNFKRNFITEVIQIVCSWKIGST